MDIYSKELGLAMCICKKAFGNKGNFNDVFHEWVYTDEPDESMSMHILKEIKKALNLDVL